jgi:hypothetical protein
MGVCREFKLIGTVIYFLDIIHDPNFLDTFRERVPSPKHHELKLG